MPCGDMRNQLTNKQTNKHNKTLVMIDSTRYTNTPQY